MKTLTERLLPFVLMLAGGLRVLWERFPHRLPFLRVLGGEHLGWLFWTLGLTGLVWLLLQALPESAAPDAWHAGGSGRAARFFSAWGPELLILFITAASLSMLVRSGYYWDDAVNSTAYLAEKKDSIPTFRHVLDFMKEYLKLGRINILSFYYYFFFYIENVSVYKALIILSILADQLIFRVTLTEFGVTKNRARMGMLLIPLMLQTRVYQDPVSGFYSLMQVLTAEMLLCAFFLSRWLRSGRGRELALSLVFFSLGLLTYEVCFPFIAMIFLLILVRRRSFRKTVRDSLPFVVPVVLALAAVVFVRAKYVTKTTYAGVAFSMDPLRILRAGLTQITAGMPLSFYSAGYQAAVLDNVHPAASFMNYSLGSFLGAVRLSDLMLLLAAVFALRRISAEGNNTSAPEFGSLAVLGFSFALLPAVTVAMSSRYQGQLMPGLGYLPVYMQYYGIVMLLLWLTLKLKAGTGVRALCLSAFAVILLLNLQNNRAVTEIMNRVFYFPRNAGEAALHGGILDFLEEDAVLVSVNDRRMLWEADWNNRGLYPQFYGNNSRRIPGTVGDTKLLSGFAENAEGPGTVTPENVWLISYSGGTDRGFARLGRLCSAEFDPDSGELRSAVTDGVLYFISGKFPEQASVQYTRSDGTFVRSESSELQRVRLTEYGILYSLPAEEKVWFDSLTGN